jgi:hypothetical protein
MAVSWGGTATAPNPMGSWLNEDLGTLQAKGLSRTGNMEEIQKADSRTRRRALLTLAGVTVIGLVFIAVEEFCRPALEQWLIQDPNPFGLRLKLGLAILTVTIAGPALGFAIYFWRFGRRVVGAERFPPPGLPLVRDTVVMHGRAARRRGRIIQWIAVGLAVFACGVAIMLWRLVSLMGSRAG